MTTITTAELLDLANSSNPADNKRAFEIYKAWIKAAPQLDPKDRINATTRLMLTRLFNSKNLR
jgi:hypothetical protein